MEFVKFGRTGLTVSRICIGTGTFGKQTDEGHAYRILDKVAEAGVNFIDTADIYPPGGAFGSGNSEIITGRWLSGKQDRFILGTKAGGPMGHTPWDKSNSRKHLPDAIDGSLRRLNTENTNTASPLKKAASRMNLVGLGKNIPIGIGTS